MAVSAKMANLQANNVLKYLRWRSSSPEGEVGDSFEGIAFDCSLDGVQPLTYIMPWIGAQRGQAGHWGEVGFEWLWRDWVHAWGPADRQHLHGGTITACVCRPIKGTKDPCLGMSGPAWGFFFPIK
jgi:hypothetical protein